MKHSLLAICLLSSMSVAAWNVSTETTKQNVLIEEFTGIQCPNCPDGHAIAALLHTLNPDDVFSVAIHAGYYSHPGMGEPDYVTEVGKAVHDFFDISSYPCAIVNRGQVNDGMAIGRGYWGPACREILKKDSPVNLWTSSTYDPDTRVLTLEVEGYYTADMTDPRLNVFLLQSEIVGPQKGGLKGDEYHHRHMLRGRLTDNDFGDKLSVKTAGEYFSRTFTYTLPADIDGIPTDPVNTELLTFVTEGDDNVVKVSHSRPDTSTLDQMFIVDFAAAPLAISKNYALNYIEVVLYNHGGFAVSSAEFNLTLNSKVEQVEWVGMLPAHSSAVIRVPLTPAWADVIDNESNKYSIRLMKANGIEVETSSVSGKFNEIFNYPAKLRFAIKTDLDAADNTWRIIDTDGNVVKEFGPYEDGVAKEYYETDVQLEPNTIYGLQVYDRWGDGVRHPAGQLRIFDANDVLVAQIKEIKDYGVMQFFRTGDASGVADAAIDNAELTGRSYYDISGRSVSTPAAGIYVVRSTYSDGSVRVEKVSVK